MRLSVKPGERGVIEYEKLWLGGQKSLGITARRRRQ